MADPLSDTSRPPGPRPATHAVPRWDDGCATEIAALLASMAQMDAEVALFLADDHIGAAERSRCTSERSRGMAAVEAASSHQQLEDAAVQMVQVFARQTVDTSRSFRGA